MLNVILLAISTMAFISFTFSTVLMLRKKMRGIMWASGVIAIICLILAIVFRIQASGLIGNGLLIGIPVGLIIIFLATAGAFYDASQKYMSAISLLLAIFFAIVALVTISSWFWSLLIFGGIIGVALVDQMELMAKLKEKFGE